MTKLVKFEEPYISCKEERVIPYIRLENVTRYTTLEDETCEIVNCVQCIPFIENICQDIEVANTFQEIIENCTQVVQMVPHQDFEHIERCFFHQNPSTGGIQFIFCFKHLLNPL